MRSAKTDDPSATNRNRQGIRASGREDYLLLPSLRQAGTRRLFDSLPAFLQLRRNRCLILLTSVALQATLDYAVQIRSFAHKGLRKLYTDEIAQGVPPNSADKLRKMLSFLDNMQNPEELRSLPSWKPHLLTGDRKGTWSLSVTRNLRLTFWIDFAEHEICDVNLEDYH